MCDMSSGIRLHFHPILVPDTLHILIGDLTLENSLILGLYSEVSNALVNLKFLLCMVRKQRFREWKLQSLILYNGGLEYTHCGVEWMGWDGKWRCHYCV